MSSDEESDTVEASISLLTEQVYVPETQHNEFQFVAEDDETSHDERQSPRKSKRGSQTKKRKYSQNIYEKNDTPTFDRQSRHKKVSPTKGINKRTVQKLGLPNKWDDDNDKYHAMINVSSNMESFFPCVELNTDSWGNIHAVICHATHAYTRINEEKKQLQSADSKISALEEQIKLLEKQLLQEKTQHEVKACLTMLASEVEEELIQKIGNFIWFVVEHNSSEKTSKGVYNPSVGRNDYKSVLGMLCYHYIFKQSRKFQEKFRIALKNRDMSDPEQSFIIWKYMWSTNDLGKKISHELNQKRNSFAYVVKTALEVVLTAKDEIFSSNFLLSLSKWITNPTFCSNEFHVIKNSLFVIISAAKNSKMYHHNNLKTVLHDDKNKIDDKLYFVPEIIKIMDGVRMMDTLSINDVAFTCVLLRNCIQICPVSEEKNITDMAVRENQDIESTSSSLSDNNTLALTRYNSQSQSSNSDLSRSLSWNGHLRNRPKHLTKVYFVDDYDTIKEFLENSTKFEIYTGGKRYTGGVSGSGHSWTLTGVNVYEAIRKKLVREVKNYTSIHFSCNTQEEKFGLAANLNNEEREEFQSMFEGEMDIDDLLVSGQFTAV